jgi:N-ethylmaleimide reductase
MKLLIGERILQKTSNKLSLLSVVYEQISKKVNMNDHILLTSYRLGRIELNNRVVMSPMTRSRAIGNVPNELMARYYGQRSGAGLIITEGTSPSPNGLGYARIPGLFSNVQVEGWKRITSAVHDKGGKIFVQFMHTGRIAHKLNLPDGARIIAPSAIKAAGKIFTDQQQMQEFPIPEEMTAEDLSNTKKEYIDSAKNSVTAGFDGVEFHSANGYLLEQFLSPLTNIRTDNYGGSIENRCRFILEVVAAVADAIGKENIGIRISPYGIGGDMHYYPGIDATYNYLSESLNKLGIAYIHIADHSAMGAPPVPAELKKRIRDNFKNTVILSGGYNLERADNDIRSRLGDLVAFGKPFLNNPDLVERFRNGWPLSKDLDSRLFYTPGERGYTDYPNYEVVSA